MRLHLFFAATRGLSSRRGAWLVGLSRQSWPRTATCRNASTGCAPLGRGISFDGLNTGSKLARELVGRHAESWGGRPNVSVTDSGMGPSSRKKKSGRTAEILSR